MTRIRGFFGSRSSGKYTSCVVGSTATEQSVVVGFDVETDRKESWPLDRATFVYDALYAWCARQITSAV
jgi:hypothetical protein